MFQMKKNLRWRALKSGALVTLSLGVVFLAVVFAGTLREMFKSTVPLDVRFQDVKGLRTGAPVRLNGMEIGSVKRIQLDPVDGTIVTLSLEKRAASFLRSNARAEIMTMGLLGDKYVELNSGSARAAPLSAGETIEGKTPTELKDVVEASIRAVEKIGTFIGEVEELVQSASKGEGTFSKFMHDPALYESLVKSAKSMESTLERIEKSQGTLGRLVQDDALYRKLMATASSLETWSDALNRRSGTLKKLIEDPSLYDRTLSAFSNLDRVTAKIEAGRGTLGRMLTEPGLYENLNGAAKNLEAVLRGIDEGKGMAGALLRDEEMAAEVKGTLAEIRGLADEMRVLLDELKAHPEKYFRFSIF